MPHLEGQSPGKNDESLLQSFDGCLDFYVSRKALFFCPLGAIANLTAAYAWIILKRTATRATKPLVPRHETLYTFVVSE